MAEAAATGEMTRLEDFIRLAKEGKDVHVMVELRKLTFKQKVHPGETEESTGEIESYLLVGDYTCRVKDVAHKIEKIYVMGSMEEPLDAARMHRNIANERLKMDYRRLKDARIKIEERYF